MSVSGASGQQTTAAADDDEDVELDDLLEQQFNKLNDSTGVKRRSSSVASNIDRIMSDSEESIPADEPIPPYSPTVTAPPPAEQLATVTPMLNRPLRAKETWCLITKKWLTQWRAYTHYYKIANGDASANASVTAAESTANVDAPLPPGPIDNFVLFKDENCSELAILEQPDRYGCNTPAIKRKRARVIR
ncbi:hypothetical protein BDF22DRAFT_656188 [Syncephalis plumigaleata]|nr:hypothetical protein BDF22DRAFT_656188 [Syncephalis plumigaleata]